MIDAVGAVGAAVGPIVGGFLTTYYTWKYAFLGEVIIVIFVLIFSRVIQKDILSKVSERFYFTGSLLTVAGLGAIVLGILSVSKYGFFPATQPVVICDLELNFFGISIAAILMFVGFIFVWQLFRYESKLEEKGTPGLFKPSTFKIRDFNSSEGVRFFNMYVRAGALYLFPLFMQLTFELDAIDTGLRLMPFTLALIGAAIIGSKMSARFSAKKLIQVGVLIFGIATIILTLVIGDNNFDTNVMLVTIIFGVGLGLVASQIVNVVLSTVNAEDSSEAAGLNATVEQLGNSIGVALVGIVMLAGLMFTASELVTSSDVIPPENKQELVNEIDDGVQLLSDSVIQESLEDTDTSDEIKDEISSIYSESRLVGFQMAMVVLFLASLLAFIISFQLPDKKLVTE